MRDVSCWLTVTIHDYRQQQRESLIHCNIVRCVKCISFERTIRVTFHLIIVTFRNQIQSVSRFHTQFRSLRGGEESSLTNGFSQLRAFVRL